jgi:hypothetical protein
MAKSMGLQTIMVAKIGGLDMKDEKFALHGFLMMIVNEEMTRD